MKRSEIAGLGEEIRAATLLAYAAKAAKAIDIPVADRVRIAPRLRSLANDIPCLSA